MTDSCTEWHVQEHCYGGETDLQCGNSQVILTTRLPTDIAKYLHINVGLHFTPAELICYEQSYACFKNDQHAFQTEMNLSGFLWVWR